MRDDMLNAEELRHEIARLLAEMRADHQAIQKDVAGMNCNEFTMKRMENMQKIRNMLCEMVGNIATVAMVAQELEEYSVATEDLDVSTSVLEGWISLGRGRRLMFW